MQCPETYKIEACECTQLPLCRELWTDPKTKRLFDYCKCLCGKVCNKCSKSEQEYWPLN